MSDKGINWASIDEMAALGINWSSINEMSLAQINWSDIQVMSDENINWGDVFSSSTFTVAVFVSLPDRLPRQCPCCLPNGPLLASSAFPRGCLHDLYHCASHASIELAGNQCTDIMTGHST